MIRIPDYRLKSAEADFYNRVSSHVRPRLELTRLALATRDDSYYSNLESFSAPKMSAQSKTKYVKSLFVKVSSLNVGAYKDELNGKSIKIPTAQRLAVRAFCDYLLAGDNLKRLLVGEPVDLNTLINTPVISVAHIALLRWWVEGVFNYVKILGSKDQLSSYSYALSRAIGLELCPYCNRMYTHVVERSIGGKLTRPQFDHYFSQKDFPVLSVSLYNLVPSCSICNLLKSDDHFLPTTHAHPYIDEMGENIRFNVLDTLSGSGQFSVAIVEDYPWLKSLADKHRQSCDSLGICDIYASHRDEIGEVLRKLKLLSRGNIAQLKSILGPSVSEREVLRFYFGVYLEKEHWGRRPFSKLIHDMIKTQNPDLLKY
jgi:hypothetical protein